jgi:hypothetical protein
MVFSFLYVAVRALLGALVRSRRGLDVKDVELMVLRHQLEVLRRQVERPQLGPVDAACGSCVSPAALVTGSASGHAADAVALASSAGASEMAAACRPARPAAAFG